MAHPITRVACRALPLILTAAMLASSPRSGETAGERPEAPAGLDRLGAWFDAHPELKETRSSGWKPYNRARWFHETRRSASPAATPGAVRQEVFELVRAREVAAPVGAGWFSTGPTHLSGRCVSIDFHPTDPDVVYVGSAGGGLWKTTNGGDSWQTATDELPVLAIGAVCVLAQNPDVVLIGTGEGAGVGFVNAGKGLFSIGLLKSTDGGATFGETSLSYPVNSTAGFSIIEDNALTGTILAGTNDGLWRSTDEGDTWTRVLADGNFFDVKWKPGSASRVYVAKGRDPFINSQSNNGIFVSDDDGLTFALLGSGQPPGIQIGKTKIGVTAADPAVIYAHYVGAFTSATLGIYRSTDGGATWQLRNGSINMTGGQGWYNLILGVDPTDPERIVTGGVNVYTSDGGGVTYDNINQGVPLGNATTPHWDEHALVLEPGSTSNLWIATDGGVWRSTDVGATWQSRREGIITYQFYDICVAQSDLFFTMGGTQDNGIPGRFDLADWFESTFIADGMVCNIDPADADVVYAEWQFGNHIKSLTRGQNWFNIMNGLSGSGAWVTPVDQDQNDGDHLYTETSAGIFRTRTGGNLWEQVAAHDARWISISPADGNVVWTVSPTSAGVWTTPDDGTTWLRADTFPLSGRETKISAHPVDLQQAFVTVGGYATGAPHLLMTSDAGASWVDVTGNFPDQPANTFIIDRENPDHWYLGSDVGVWLSTDGGATWDPFGTGLANSIVTDLEIRYFDRKLLAGTYGRGVWEVELPSAAGVAGATAGPLPRHLMLDRPFLRGTDGPVTLRYAARVDDQVRLRIVDVQGRVVETLIDLPVGDGVVRQATWSPGEVSSGVYFAVLHAGSEQIARKVLITR